MLPAVNPLTVVVGEAGLSTVPVPVSRSHETVSPVLPGTGPFRMAVVRVSQNVCTLFPTVVIPFFGAGTVIVIVADPVTHGPDTLHLNV